MDEAIPAACLVHVATFLDLRDLPAFALVSRRLRDAARHEFVFETLARGMGLTLVSAAASRGSRESQGDGDGSRQWFELLRHVVPSRREARLILNRFEREAMRLQLRRRQAQLAHRAELRRRRLRRLARLSGSTSPAASTPPWATGFADDTGDRRLGAAWPSHRPPGDAIVDEEASLLIRHRASGCDSSSSIPTSAPVGTDRSLRSSASSHRSGSRSPSAPPPARHRRASPLATCGAIWRIAAAGR
ncbi:hypothetical protein FNF29_02372 [Cafeteria roenbergensis]|uniref:F-box domain-containing protein n=1 Tax=Cafeteria roenbergensis TaxID=33653 RepID=A0A5A8CN65_CAFRO|nr:hypothetical protein FNF29_02372 [Cafeteria roenbergensis]|eukprot:KAA0154495.1 hypothetical protein FNF29_02372 [Cafeteria roenbergensis]